MIRTAELDYEPKHACPLCLYNEPLRLRGTDYTPRRAA